MFADIAELAKGAAACLAHKKSCHLATDVFLLVVGYSCKDLSRVKTNDKTNVLSSGTGTSGETCRGMLDHIQATRPVFVLLENVEEMAKPEEDSTNVEFLHSSLRAMKYSVDVDLFDSARFQIPCRRLRAWGLAADYEALHMTEEEGSLLVEQILSFAKTFESPELDSLSPFLLEQDSPLVAQELARRATTAKVDKTSQTTSFLKLHQHFLASKGLNWSRLSAPKDVLNSEWFELFPRREKEVLAYALQDHPRCVAVDVSSRMDRVGISDSVPIHTLTSTTKLFLRFPAGVKSDEATTPLNRVLLGWEALNTQGFPMPLLKAFSGDFELSDTQMGDLAGNAFSSTVVLTIMLSLYVKFPMSTSSSGLEPGAKADSGDDLAAVMALFS